MEKNIPDVRATGYPAAALRILTEVDLSPGVALTGI